MKIGFAGIRDFDRGIMSGLLARAYSFDPCYERHFGHEWKFWEDFFFDHPHIADTCGFVTTLDARPIGFIVWDPRNMPEYAEIGNSCIVPEYKGRGYGVAQLQQAVDRIRKGTVKRIVVTTNAGLLPARHMYERVGFREWRRRENPESPFAGEYIDYEYIV